MIAVFKCIKVCHLEQEFVLYDSREQNCDQRVKTTGKVILVHWNKDISKNRVNALLLGTVCIATSVSQNMSSIEGFLFSLKSPSTWESLESLEHNLHENRNFIFLEHHSIPIA